MKAATYCRVSTGRQADEGLSLEVQAARTRDYAEREGWEVVAEFVDAGVSGRKASRPGLDTLREAAHAGEIEVVVVAKLDRLGRSLKHLLQLVDELDALGVRVVFLDLNVDSSTTLGRFFVQVVAAIAELEASFIGERTKDGKAAARAKGRYLGGPVPFGYRPEKTSSGSHFVVDEKQAECVRIASGLLVEEGLTVRQTATRLNALGYRTQGSPSDPPRSWNNHLLRHMLAQPSLVDYRGFGVLSDDRWGLVQQTLGEGTRGPYRQGRPEGYPLSGYLISECGEPMTGQWIGKLNRGSYRCKGIYRRTDGAKSCGCSQVNADWIENVVRTKLSLDMLRPENVASLVAEALAEKTDEPDDREALKKRLVELDDRLHNLLTLDAVSGEALQRAASELAEQREAVASQLNRKQRRRRLDREVVDEAREAAEAALTKLWTPEGLRAALRDYDVRVKLYRRGGSRRVRVTGRVVVTARTSTRAGRSPLP